jgi:hypothetical protein
MIFSRHGGTPAVRAAAKKAGARVITFAEIARDLGRLPEKKIR